MKLEEKESSSEFWITFCSFRADIKHQGSESPSEVSVVLHLLQGAQGYQGLSVGTAEKCLNFSWINPLSSSMASFEQASNLSKPQQGKPYKHYQDISTLKNIPCSSEGAWTHLGVQSSARRTPIGTVIWPSWLPSTVAAVFLHFLLGMMLGLHNLSSLQADKDLWQTIHMEWESCHHKTPVVTWDSEKMVGEQYLSFLPNLGPFKQLTTAFQLWLQHLWALMIHLGLYTCRKAYRAWHIPVKN